MSTFQTIAAMELQAMEGQRELAHAIMEALLRLFRRAR